MYKYYEEHKYHYNEKYNITIGKDRENWVVKIYDIINKERIAEINKNNEGEQFYVLENAYSYIINNIQDYIE